MPNSAIHPQTTLAEKSPSAGPAHKHRRLTKHYSSLSADLWTTLGFVSFIYQQHRRFSQLYLRTMGMRGASNSPRSSMCYRELTYAPYPQCEHRKFLRETIVDCNEPECFLSANHAKGPDHGLDTTDKAKCKCRRYLTQPVRINLNEVGLILL